MEVDFKNSLDFHNKVETLVIQCTDTIRQIPNVEKLRLDIELTAHICNIIENKCIVKNKKNLDKKAICMRIMSEVFNNNLTEVELKLLSDQVEYLWNNGRIKKLDALVVWGTSVFNWIKKKIV